jgi:hypothetical protein
MAQLWNIFFQYDFHLRISNKNLFTAEFFSTAAPVTVGDRCFITLSSGRVKQGFNLKRLFPSRGGAGIYACGKVALASALAPEVNTQFLHFLRASEVNRALPRSERQQRNVTCTLDGRGQPALVRRAYASQPPWDDFAPLCNELPEQTHVFVVNVVDLFHAELADFLATEKFASAAAFASAGSTIWSRTIRPSALGPWRWC